MLYNQGRLNVQDTCTSIRTTYVLLPNAGPNKDPSPLVSASLKVPNMMFFVVDTIAPRKNAASMSTSMKSVDRLAICFVTKF